MKRDNLSQDDLLKSVYKKTGIPISFGKKILYTFFNIIIDGLNRDGIVKLSGFGTFKVLKKTERIGRNPKTKVEYKINSRKVVSFYPSEKVKKQITNLTSVK